MSDNYDHTEVHDDDGRVYDIDVLLSASVLVNYCNRNEHVIDQLYEHAERFVNFYRTDVERARDRRLNDYLDGLGVDLADPADDEATLGAAGGDPGNAVT